MLSDKAQKLIDDLEGYALSPEEGEREYGDDGTIIGGYPYYMESKYYLEQYVESLENTIKDFTKGYNPNETKPEYNKAILILYKKFFIGTEKQFDYTLDLGSYGNDNRFHIYPSQRKHKTEILRWWYLPNPSEEEIESWDKNDVTLT